MVKAPEEYKWSSYHSNVRGAYDSLVSEHVSYEGLAKNRKKQQENYRDLFLEYLDGKILNNIRKCAKQEHLLAITNLSHKLSLN